MQRDRIERKEIAIGTVRNYAKAIKLFYEMADLTVAWQKNYARISAKTATCGKIIVVDVAITMAIIAVVMYTLCSF